MAGTHIKQKDDHDIVWGTPAIGKIINREPRVVEYLCAKYPDKFPVKKVVGGYVASRKALLAWLLKKENA
ncbi:ATP-dependent RNA circularization protein (DNA/RNA ligase family) [Mesorhizobium jarvisii]